MSLIYRETLGSHANQRRAKNFEEKVMCFVLISLSPSTLFGM